MRDTRYFYCDEFDKISPILLVSVKDSTTEEIKQIRYQLVSSSPYSAIYGEPTFTCENADILWNTQKTLPRAPASKPQQKHEGITIDFASFCP